MVQGPEGTHSVGMRDNFIHFSPCFCAKVISYCGSVMTMFSFISEARYRHAQFFFSANTYVYSHTAH